MIISTSRFADIYHALKIDKYSSEDRSILIFVANVDVDSLCAAEELAHVFSKEDVHYCVQPVENVQEIRERCEELKDSEELRTIILINCGAQEDIRSLCELNHNVRAIIIDSHRPIWHGYNNQNDDVLVLLDEDDPVKLEDVPSYEEGDEEARQGMDDAEDEDLGEDSDDEDGDARGQRDQGAASTRSGDEDDMPRKKRRLLGDHQMQVREYYEHKAGYGMPASLMVFQLCHRLQYDNNFHIWLAILGLTEQFTLQRMDPHQYEKWRIQMEGHVANNGSWEEEDLDSYEEAAGLVNQRARHRMTVAKCEDLRFTLLRHWTLHDSMQHTEHVATRMQTWREAGRKQLQLLLALMNVPLKESSVAYTSMRPLYRDSLKAKLQKHAARLGLNYEALKLPSFELQYKNDVRVSALDMVHAITALLAMPRTEDRTAKDIYHEACESLYLNQRIGLQQLKAGIDRARKLSKAIVEDGGLAITRNQVLGSKRTRFWYINLADVQCAYKEFFQHPTALLRLAIFLRDCMRQRRSRAYGMVVVGAPDSQRRCYVVSIRNKQTGGMLQNNPFSIPFQQAVQGLNIDTMQSATFDSTMHLIPREMVDPFIEELKAVVQTYLPADAEGPVEPSALASKPNPNGNGKRRRMEMDVR